MFEHRQDRRDRKGRRRWRLPVALLLTAMLLITGYGVITGVITGCAPTWGAGSGPPEPAELGEIAVTYLDTGGMGYLGLGDGQRLVVTKDGRALVLRADGERLVLTLSPAELEQLRDNLARDVGWWQGDFEPLGPPASDLPVHSLTFVDTGRAVHQVHYECGDPEGGWMAAAVDRLTALRERVLAEGAVDTGAPIQVTFSVDQNRIDGLQRDAGAWPADLTPPEVPADDYQLTYRMYEGDQAARLRKLIGRPEHEDAERAATVTLPDGTVVATWWSAVLPGIGGEAVF